MISIGISPISNYSYSNSTTKPKINKTNFPNLFMDLDNECWLSVYSQTSVSQAYNCFIELVKFYIDKNSTLVEIKNKDRIIKPWITKKLCRKIKLKNKLSKKLAKSPSNLYLKREVSVLSKSVKTEVNVAKNEYYQTKFNNADNDVKKSWRLVDELLGNGRKRTGIDSIVVDEQHEISDELEMAELFNNYFVGVVQDLKADANDNVEVYRELICSNSESRSFVFHGTFPLEILDVIASLKSTSSTGNDSVSSFMVKKIGIYIVDVLSYIINCSFSSGIFPSKLKQANVIPVHKSGDKKNIVNYRPISLLSVFAKIIE